MNFREPSRPFDPTAMTLHNLIIHEHRPLGDLGQPIFVPSHGPFYSESLAVYSGARLLVRGKDYRTLVHHPRATEKTGKEVSVCVMVINKSLTEIDITYQAVGGEFQHLFEIIKLIKESNGDQFLRAILWHEIIGKPDTFNPAAHWHVVWDIKGWESLITPLDQIRQAVIFKKQQAYRAAYDYYYAKKIAHQNDVDSRLAALRLKATDLWKRIRPPVGMIGLYTKPQASFPDGNYKEIRERLLFGVELDADLGKEWNVSKDLVFQYPDNILLNEKDYPILQEKDEWIYLDNQHPVSGMPTGEKYWEEIDELFDTLCIKIYAKESNGGEIDANLTVNTAMLNEGEVALFQLTTVGFAAGTVIMYQLTDIGPTNVSVPLMGAVTLNALGVGTLAVKLIEGSPRTDLQTMKIEMMIMGGLPLRLNYNLISNRVEKTETTVHQYANGPLLKGTAVRGDIYSLRIVHRGANGQKLQLRTTGLTVNDVITVGDNSYYGNAVVEVPTIATSKVISVPFTVKSRTGASPVDIGLRIATPNGTTETVPFTAVPFAFLGLEIYSPETGATLTSLKYGQLFRIRVRQNSRDNSVVELQLSANTTTGVLNPSFIPPLYCGRDGIGESGTYTLLPVNEVAPAVGVLTFTAVDPVTNTINIKTTIPVTI